MTNKEDGANHTFHSLSLISQTDLGLLVYEHFVGLSEFTIYSSYKRFTYRPHYIQYYRFSQFSSHISLMSSHISHMNSHISHMNSYISHMNSYISQMNSYISLFISHT